GRFVPENNYETIIREFMSSDTKRDLVIICNHEGNSYFNELREKTAFDQDERIKFVGTVYDQELLKYIRNHAFAYLHGHEVGGTNPGLLEALAQT
ncbi:glycosyl transferase, partial [Streptococcus gordonii]|nr:glycosyl transferase [Streptococcus gordonii]